MRPLISIVLMLSFIMGFANNFQDEKKNKVRISLQYETTNNTDKQLSANVKSKIGRSYSGVEGVEVNFYVNVVSDSTLIDNQITNSDGIATIQIDPDKLARMSDAPELVFIASSVENESFLANSKKIEVWDSKLEVNLIEQDSTYNVNLKFMVRDSTNQFVPKEGVGIKLFVKRLFGNLPVDIDYEATDGKGEIELLFPDDFKGGENGAITIISQLDDDGDYGMVRNIQEVNWGEPLVVNLKESRRELWTARSNTPIYLLVLINGMILGVWGTIAYLVFQIVKIKKLGKLEN